MTRPDSVASLFGDPIILDSFSGAGGASTGIRAALGRGPNIAINHNSVAIGVHQANHPEAVHHLTDVWEADPRLIAAGRRVELAWFSPDCRHFSKAKGRQPVSPRVRGLAWYACQWARYAPPRVIVLENVEEFRTWGPLIETQPGVWLPDPDRSGETFAEFVAALRALGYHLEHRELRACDYGAPTIRKRLFIVARCDRRPIVWPRPTHGPGLLPYRQAADIIDWRIPCPSIFDRPRPLAAATLRRIADGLRRYVLEAHTPYLVPDRHPQLSGSPHACAWLAQHNTGVIGRTLTAPLSTVTATGSQQALCTAILGSAPSRSVTAYLVQYYGTSSARALTEPLPTVTTHDRFGLVTVHGAPLQIIDIGMRMLTVRELASAQGFPADYVLDRQADGTPVNRTDQTRLVGNSVCPPIAEALVRANLPELADRRLAA